MGGYCLSFVSWLSCWRSSAPARSACTTPSAPASRGSSSNGTSASAPSAPRRPSLYLLLASTLLLVAASVALLGQNGGSDLDDRGAELRARGWLEGERLPCPGARAGTFYELEGESEATEALALAQGRSLVARLPLPEKILQCREIPGPHFIQEIE